MKDEALFARLLENLSTQSETPHSSELSPLSDLDQSQFNRFEPVWNSLSHQQRQTLLTSLGKLAEVLGLDPISARNYLKDKGIPIQSQDLHDLTQDAENA